MNYFHDFRHLFHLQITCSTEGERERKNKQIIGKHKKYENIFNFIRERESKSESERERDREQRKRQRTEKEKEKEKEKVKVKEKETEKEK